MDRKRDDGRSRHDFQSAVLVRCPRCGSRAWVVRVGGAEQRRRLTCDSCALVRYAGRESLVSQPCGATTEPYFGAELLLQTSCAGRALWAYNVEHLDAMEAYVVASLRERRLDAGARECLAYYGSMLETLPSWIKEAAHRDRILHALRSMRQLA